MKIKYPRLPNPAKRFTAKQLATLREKFAGIKKIDPESPTYGTLIAAMDLYTQPMIKQLAKADIKFLSALARNRIKRKGNPMRKKKRSAKQLANDKRLGRMAKARAKKKGKKKTTRRKKNVIRKGFPKRIAARSRGYSKKGHSPMAMHRSHFLIFKCKGNNVLFLTFSGAGSRSLRWTKDKQQAMLFSLKKSAATHAKQISAKRGLSTYAVGVAPDNLSASQIRVQCGGKA